MVYSLPVMLIMLIYFSISFSNLYTHKHTHTNTVWFAFIFLHFTSILWTIFIIIIHQRKYMKIWGCTFVNPVMLITGFQYSKSQRPTDENVSENKWKINKIPNLLTKCCLISCPQKVDESAGEHWSLLKCSGITSQWGIYIYVCMYVCIVNTSN